MQKWKDTFKKKQCGQFVVVHKVAEGGFGEVFVARKEGSQQKYALKISTQKKYIDNEIAVYQLLSKDKGYSGLPIFGGYGSIDNFVYFGMQLLGNDLHRLRKEHKRLSLKSVLMIAEQAISRLKFLHSKGFVHRDVKPENFCLGSAQKKQSHRIYLIDLGLCKRIGDPEDKGGIIGTPSFMSMRAHSSMPLGPADDIESLIYSLIELLYGSLPWQNMPSDSKPQLDKIRAIKKRCTRWGEEPLPVEFTSALMKIREEGEVDHEWYRDIFRKCMDRLQGSYDYQFEWIKKQQQKQEKKVKGQVANIQLQCKVVNKFLQEYSRVTIEPQLGRGELKQKKAKKPLPNPAQFYLKRLVEQVKDKPMTGNGPRIAMNQQPRSKH